MIENSSLEGEVAVVVGGLGQLGRVTSKALLSRGAAVCVLDTAPSVEADEFIKRNQNRSRLRYFEVDITDEKCVQDGAIASRELLGPTSILIVLAHYKGPRELAPGHRFFSPPETYPLDEWNRALAVNLTGLLNVIKAYGSQMIEAQRGSIVATSSTYGIVSPDPRVYGESGINSPIAYAATKSAILGITRYLAVHWAKHGIRVNAIVPGGIEHPAQSDGFRKAYIERTPLGRMAVPEDYLDAIMFLVSSQSRYMTGQQLVVDGGWTAW